MLKTLKFVPRAQTLSQMPNSYLQLLIQHLCFNANTPTTDLGSPHLCSAPLTYSSASGLMSIPPAVQAKTLAPPGLRRLSQLTRLSGNPAVSAVTPRPDAEPLTIPTAQTHRVPHHRFPAGLKGQSGCHSSQNDLFKPKSYSSLLCSSTSGDGPSFLSKYK